MGRFNDRGQRGGQFFGRGGFGRKNFDRGGDGRGDRGDRQMFKTVCSNCGKDCEVPFRPTNSKPVYCSDCFEKMGGRNSGRGDRGDRSRFNNRRPEGARVDQYKGQFENLNIKLDKILRLLDPANEVAFKNEVIEDPKVVVETQIDETNNAEKVEEKEVKKTKKNVKKVAKEEASEE